MLFLSLFAISLTVYLWGKNAAWETLSIVFGVTSYHFWMRLLVGAMMDQALHNHVDDTKGWFAEKPIEKKLYKAIHIKKWKNMMPTYDPGCFDMKKHSVSEIMGAGCQAEIVHEVIMVLSFLPTVLTIWFKPAAVFIITSVFAALFDSLFVMMQRYNRPRLRRLYDRLCAENATAHADLLQEDRR